jgi:hypothetical protein
MQLLMISNENGMLVSQDSSASKVNLPCLPQIHSEKRLDLEEIKEDDIMRLIKMCDEALKEKPFKVEEVNQ